MQPTGRKKFSFRFVFILWTLHVCPRIRYYYINKKDLYYNFTHFNIDSSQYRHWKEVKCCRQSTVYSSWHEYSGQIIQIRSHRGLNVPNQGRRKTRRGTIGIKPNTIKLCKQLRNTFSRRRARACVIHYVILLSLLF